MKFYKKYQHVGISHPGVPDGWIPIVKKAIISIEKEMWPAWMPFPIKRLIHWLATGNSVVHVKYWWAYRLRSRFTNGQMITDIKEKYATLRIYGDFNDKIHKIVKEGEIECRKTCQTCGSTNDVRMNNTGWFYNLCRNCRAKNGSEE